MNRQVPDLMLPRGIKKADAAVVAAQRALDHAMARQDEIRAKAKIVCGNCRVAFPICTQDYIQTYWYTPPYGCTGGDYWNEGEANWICPACGQKNRFTAGKPDATYRDFHRPELVALKLMFKSRRACHCRVDYSTIRGWYICDSCKEAAAAKAAEKVKEKAK